MKLHFPVESLWERVQKMGASKRSFVLSRSTPTPLPSISTNPRGEDVTIDEVDTYGGLLSSNGAQIVLYIPDQTQNIDRVLVDGGAGRRVHVADCITLEDMRIKNRFQRYRAVVNITGNFEVFGFSRAQQVAIEGEASLQVCKNCLKHLNYRGYATEPRRQGEIHRTFNLREFFAEHSTLFRYLPKEFIERKVGYAKDWASISEKYRASMGYTCEQCTLNLARHKYLLHAHHIDGNKHNNHEKNLKALCADCHRKEPLHDFMAVNSQDMTKIQALRREQGILGANSGWEELFALVDPPFQGLLRLYKASGSGVPEVGYELLNDTGVVIAELEVAWPEARFAVVTESSQSNILERLGWKVETLEEALKSFS